MSLEFPGGLTVGIFYYFLLLLTSFLWAGNFVAGKFLVGHASSLVLTEIRWLIAIVCLLPFVWIKEKSIGVPKKAILPLVLMGLTGVVLFNTFMFLALRHTTADNVGLLSTLNPISIAIASFIFFRDKLTLKQIGAMTISLTGILIVLSHGSLAKIFNLHFNVGDLYMIVAVAIWGLYSVFSKKSMEYVSPYKSTLWSGIFGVAFMLPFTYSTFEISSPGMPFWLATIYSGFGATVLAMVFWNIGIQKVGATVSGMFLNFNPIFTALLAYFLLDEVMTVTQWAGSFIVIAGVYLFTRKGPEPVSKKLDASVSS